MFLDVFVFISGVCVCDFLSHLLGPGVFPPLLVTFKIRFDDSRSRRWRPRTHRFSLLQPAQQGGSPFAFELRLLGLVLGLVGVRFTLITLNLRASRPSTYPFRAVAPVASAWRRPSGLRRVRGAGLFRSGQRPLPSWHALSIPHLVEDIVGTRDSGSCMSVLAVLALSCLELWDSPSEIVDRCSNVRPPIICGNAKEPVFRRRNVRSLRAGNWFKLSLFTFTVFTIAARYLSLPTRSS